MVARNNDNETNQRNHYYDDQARRSRSSDSDDGWGLPYFSLNDFAYWIGTKIGEYQYYADLRKAEKQAAAQRKAEHDDAHPEEN